MKWTETSAIARQLVVSMMKGAMPAGLKALRDKARKGELGMVNFAMLAEIGAATDAAIAHLEQAVDEQLAEGPTLGSYRPKGSDTIARWTLAAIDLGEQTVSLSREASKVGLLRVLPIIEFFERWERAPEAPASEAQA